MVVNTVVALPRSQPPRLVMRLRQIVELLNLSLSVRRTETVVAIDNSRTTIIHITDTFMANQIWRVYSYLSTALLDQALVLRLLYTDYRPVSEVLRCPGAIQSGRSLRGRI